MNILNNDNINEKIKIVGLPLTYAIHVLHGLSYTVENDNMNF